MITLGPQPIAVLRFFGLLPPRDPSERVSLFFRVSRAVLLAVIVTVTVSMSVQLFVAPELDQLARTIEIWTLLLSGLYKLGYVIAKGDDFVKLNDALTRARTTADRSAVADRLRHVRRMTQWYLFSGVIGWILGVVNPLVSYPRGDRSKFHYFNDPKSYPIICWIPFPINDIQSFLAIFILHSFTALYMVILHLSLGSFMFGSIYMIGGQIELLNVSLNTIDNTRTKNGIKLTENQNDQCYKKIRECALQHVSLLKCINDAKTLFGSLLIVDYLHGVTSLTFALFQLTISTNVSEVISIMFFVLLGVGHQFLNNYFGEYIVQKQLSFYLAVYNNVPWISANTKINSLIKMMIMRSQKPQFIIGFYIYKFCNESFVLFLKSLYTYYMVLRSINSDHE